MIAQLGESLVFRAMYVASKQGKTGLAVTVDVYSPAGVKVVTGAAATEVGDGVYAYTLAGASVDTAGEYVAIFKTVDTTVEQQHMPALWVAGRAGVEHLDADVSSMPSSGSIADAVMDESLSAHNTSGTAGAALNKIGTGIITTVSPVAQSGDVTLVRGDDYSATDGRALEWAVATPNLTLATVDITIDRTKFTASVVAGPPQKVRLELTNVQTAAFNVGTHTFDVQATIGTRKLTLVRGTAKIYPNITE